MKKYIISLFLFGMLASVTVQTASGYIPTPENQKAREEFQNNKFGIFLHWGIVCWQPVSGQ